MLYLYAKSIPERRLNRFHLLSSLLIEIAPIRPFYRGKSVFVRLRVGTDNGAIASYLENPSQQVLVFDYTNRVKEFHAPCSILC